MPVSYTHLDKKDASDGDGKTVLTFWCHDNAPWVKAYKEMGKKFEKANPDYKVEVQEYPFEVYNDKIQTALTSSTSGPDIIAVWGGLAPSFIQSDACLLYTSGYSGICEI